MKRKSKFRSIIMLLVSIVALTTASFITSCSGNSWWFGSNDEYEDYEDPYVIEQIEETINPSFTSVEEVILFRNKMAENLSIDETFNGMPQETLKNVATVCLRKYDSVKKKDLVTEYTLNKSVYDNLPVTNASKNNTDTVENAPTADKKQLPNTTSTYYKTDTINGKPVRIIIKEERVYEDA